MEQNRQISDDELMAVTGGTGADGRSFSGLVEPDKAEKGAKYYIVTQNGRTWFYGVLEDSREEGINSFLPFGLMQVTKRRHKFTILQKNGVECHYQKFFFADEVSLYTTMN